MNDEQLLRYSRQILMPQIGMEGQQKLQDAHVAIIGAGGLGSPVAMYLASAGVGRLTIVDDDTVELSNLQRQLLHTDSDIGRTKVDSAADTLRTIKPDVRINALATRLDKRQLEQLADDADILVDASDNFATRFAINAACVATGTPLVSGAAVRMEGQLSVFTPGHNNSPCYRCLYREGEDPDQTCADNGVLAPIVGVIGTLQALETLKLLLEIGESLCGRVLIFDGLDHEWRSIKLSRDPGCPVCSGT
jgi:adenylyltransferase/sulfurtransferase